MTPRNSFLLTLALASYCITLPAVAADPELKEIPFRAALLSAKQVDDARLRSLKSAGINAIVLELRGGQQGRPAEQQACRAIRQTQLALYYWVEVARCPQLADAHPEWMASLQGHAEWRRLFKRPPLPSENEVVKTYPWIPILNKEPFDGQLRRVQKLLAGRVEAEGVFLNDLQGAPSACGCGNHLCRWTSDYGTRRTVTPLGNVAPSRFVAAVEKFLPNSKVIPVWTTECEEHDGAKNGLCAGVGCFKGICWKAYVEQLAPIAKRNQTIGVLVPYRAFQRDLPIYGAPAGWIEHAVKSFQTMPVRHRQPAIAASRLITVLQGWEVAEEQIQLQIKVARKAGVSGFVVAYTQIKQDWQPQLHRWK